MDIEFEATFIDIDTDLVRDRLRELGAKMVKPETLMRRVVFDAPACVPGGWLRVRDEGDKITMSLKQITGNKIEDQKEICLTIDDFEAGVKLLETLGARRKAFQETKREEWHYGGCEITIDTWPGLEPFVEIEGKNEKSVREVSVELGLMYDRAIFGAVDIVYEKMLGIPPEVINKRTPEITFKNPPKKYQP